MSKSSSKRDGSPVKAGPKRILTANGKRKAKTMPQKTYVMTETKGYAITPKGDTLKKRLRRVDELEHKTSANSDPFLFNRMRAHVRAGIETFD